MGCDSSSIEFYLIENDDPVADCFGKRSYPCNHYSLYVTASLFFLINFGLDKAATTKKLNSTVLNVPDRSPASSITVRETMAWRGHLSKNIKELRFLMCQSSPASSSARTFVEKNYRELKTLNPKLPILIRECNGVEPQLWARYDFGVEKGIKLRGLTETQILKALEDLVKAGESLKA
ncbi:hypothetical protein VNO77_42400 [Canavalia gladiata]|uniref:Ribosomal protein/NADH dehydrogenase domain-containing protein n=1 Tax=Canavalia gladiata TaxID=3824 RepID=A0AAN9PNI7_CANGL